MRSGVCESTRAQLLLRSLIWLVILLNHICTPTQHIVSTTNSTVDVKDSTNVFFWLDTYPKPEAAY